MKSHADVIDAFGGCRQLAEAIGVDPKLAIHWRWRGIPAKCWHKVVLVAGNRLPNLTFDILEQTRPPSPQAKSNKKARG